MISGSSPGRVSFGGVGFALLDFRWEVERVDVLFLVMRK